MSKITDKLWIVVILFGIISLLSDFTYEGARSIIGQFLEVLHASPVWVGLSAGAGEFLGFLIRLPAGLVIDKTKKYWEFVFLGYAINLFSIPFLAFANFWGIAVILVFLERIGKGIRTPARDTLLSYCAERLGKARVFAIHESMDQIGAVLGPLFVSFLFLFDSYRYKHAFLFLGIPALGVMILLGLGMRYYPAEKLKEFSLSIPRIKRERFEKVFWFYVLAMGLFSAGIMDFPLIAYYFKEHAIFREALIPVIYTVAMLSDAVMSLIMGYFYDRAGWKAFVLCFFLSGIAPFLFLLCKKGLIVLIGIILWSIGIAVQESISKAHLLNFLPEEKRATGFGIFHAIQGLSWFLGSAVIGFLYEIDIKFSVYFIATTQILSLWIFIQKCKWGGRRDSNP